MTKFFSRQAAGFMATLFLFNQNFALAQELTEFITSKNQNISTFQEAEILEEVVSKREECVKHFRKSDLSMVAVLYSEPVHYKDENGNFQEIDNTLAEENGEFKNTENQLKVKLSKNFDNKKLVTVTSDGNEISWGYIKEKQKT